jgi:hypothetical protein
MLLSLLLLLLLKAVPLQAWSGPEGSRKLRFPDFMTTAQDGGRVVSLTHRPTTTNTNNNNNTNTNNNNNNNNNKLEGQSETEFMYGTIL